MQSLERLVKRFELLKENFNLFFYDILGMKRENQTSESLGTTEELMNVILDIRQNAKTNKNWEIADAIRNKLNEIGIVIKDTKEGAIWEKITR